MRTPALNTLARTQARQTGFLGYDRREPAQAGAFADMKNLCPDAAPFLSVRPRYVGVPGPDNLPLEGVLAGCYDVYQDVYHPEQLKQLGWTSGANMAAWPHDVIWNSEKPGDWRRAWHVKAKDGSTTYCAMMCDIGIGYRLLLFCIVFA